MRRAVCCRMQRCPNSLLVSHPSLLVTKVKFDESVYTGADAGAQFEEAPTFWWAHKVGYEHLDPTTGLKMNEGNEEDGNEDGGAPSLLVTRRTQAREAYKRKRDELLAWVYHTLC